MDYVIALVVGLVVGRLLIVTGVLSVPRIVSAFAETFAGWRPDPWPHGVQEEDRDRPWGRGAKAEAANRPALTASLGRVRPVTRVR